jgi:hypothetical protein
VASVESWRYAEGDVRQTILVHELVWNGSTPPTTLRPLRT